MKGTIIRPKDDSASGKSFGIEFDEKFEVGHTLDGKCEHGFGHFVNPECLRLIEKESDRLYLNDLPDMKFRVNSPEHSKAIQNRLFELRLSWLSGDEFVKNAESHFLYVNEGNIHHGNSLHVFDTEEARETTLDELYGSDMKKLEYSTPDGDGFSHGYGTDVATINGVDFSLSFLKEALSKI